MTAPFQPQDLRIVDPRPTRVPDAEEDTVRELLRARLEGDALTSALQALGLAPYDRHVVIETAFPAGDVCRNGHDRRQFSVLDRNGWAYCRRCKSIRAAATEKRRKEKVG